MRTSRLIGALVFLLTGLVYANAPYITFYYQDPVGTTIIRDVVVTTETEGSYYCALGWFAVNKEGNGGYSGLQRTMGVMGNDGNPFYKHLHFSLWDTPNKDPIPMIWKRPEVVVSEFGGEGTGAKSLWPFNWKVGSVYSIALKLWDTGPNQTAWGMWFHDQDNHTWYRVATWGYPVGGCKIPAGTYSFIEDYMGTDLLRGMRVGPTWKEDVTGKWGAVKSATVTERDGLPSWDAGVSGNYFFANSGGSTVNSIVSGTKLTASFADTPTFISQVPLFTAEYKTGSVVSHWHVDSSQSPPFSYKIDIFSNAQMTGVPLKTVSRIDPSALGDTITNTSFQPGLYYARFTLTDIFDKTSVSQTTFNVGTVAVNSSQYLKKSISAAANPVVKLTFRTPGKAGNVGNVLIYYGDHRVVNTSGKLIR
jgi:hypothetical protein